MKIALLFTLLPFSFLAQSVSYADVGVIVNLNSPESIEIGNYFQAARNIPTQNILYVDVPNTEVINDSVFNVLRTQIEAELQSSGLENTLNYLVTTKGVPLRRSGIDCISNQGNGDCGSVDSELSLILGTHASNIGQSNAFMHPYFNQNVHFTRSQFGMYLVTRLDGFTVGDVKQMIARSGPNTTVNPFVVQNILDLNEAQSMDSLYFMDTYISPAFNEFQLGNWLTQTDYNITPMTNQTDVLSYLTTGHGPLPNYTQNFNFVPGSFAALTTCSTAAAFDSVSSPNATFTLSDLIAQGCTAAHGYVNCIYFTQLLRADILVNRYLDQTAHYNLAESFYMAERFASWQGVIVGDPKTTLIADTTAGLVPVAASIEALLLYPNPSRGTFQIKGIDPNRELSAVICTVSGQQIQSIDKLNEQSIIEIENKGVFLVSFYENGTSIGMKKLVVE
ncbi:MAG: TIGR03790 family protein [Flavobacteriales bacterium]